ncbi:MAG TPA: hypothetical protein VKZ89_00610 [Thermobifida alba]|nr:hypothetical protein [Thermobifida alba]
MFVPAWPGQVCSLGYQIGPLIERDLGIQLTDEQAGRVIEYYRLDPVTGRRLIRRAAIRRPKGAGKSPEGAYCGYAELVGPVCFGGWSDDGQPIGVPHVEPWIQFAAVSEDQTDNVVVWLFDTLSSRPDTLREHGIDLGRTRIYLHGRPGRLEPVTAAAGSREGQRVTFAVLDQSESWTKENGGHKLADTLRRNTAKMGGWSLELQNAPMLGDGSVADRTGKASDRKAAGVYFDTREPPGVDRIDMSDPEQLRPALEFAYGESTRWVDIDRLIEEILDPDTDPADAKRYYLNTAAPSSDWAFDRERWVELGGTGLVPVDDSVIVAGFDGARFDDSTAIVCAEVATGNVWLHAAWEKPDGAGDDWEVDENEVDQAVEEMFARWRVWRFYCDPPYWESSVASWEAKYRGSDRKQAVVPWWTNRWRQVGYACRSLASAIRGGLIHRQIDEGDDVLLRHVRNAVRRPVNARDEDGKQLWSITKPAPGRKIDAAMALVLAWEARNDAIASGVRLRRAKAVGFR